MSTFGTIFNIQRYSINDGPGIRTCIFMKGCPLDCLWCHNPESKSPKSELSYAPNKCIGCRKCEAVCPNGCHSFADGVHTINRENCIGCGKCADACIGALEIFGRRISAEDAIAEAMKDELFYETSGGGVTFTGGEPFAQSEFLLAMLKEAKAKGLNVCIETCGYTKREILAEAMGYVDIFLFDCKETDADNHKAFTGVDNALIRDNLRFLAENGKKIVLRCPIIPGYNDRSEHFAKIAEIANEYPSIIRIDVEPYHPLGKTKAAQIGKEYKLSELGMTDKSLAEKWVEEIALRANCAVRRG